MPTPDELEDAAAADAVRGLKRRLEEITRKGVALYESMDPDNPGGRAMVRNLLANQLASVADPDSNELVLIPLVIEEAAREAFELSKGEAARALGVATPNTPMSETSRKLASAARDSASDELRAAAGMMASAEDADDVLNALTHSRRAVTRTEAAARFSVNRALSEGTTAVTEKAGASRLWVPERDACVHCLAYAGEVAGPGESFRGGLTFGRKPLIPAGESLPEAPLHPNCRCRVVAYMPSWDEGSGVVSRPEALKREALRSVLRGFSLPSESNRVRIDAAERALRQAGTMPKSVQDYARRAIKKGEFPRGRDFPRTAALELRKANPQLEVETPKPDPFDALPKIEPETSKSRVRQTARLRRDVRTVNPRYAEGEEWRVNCQRTSVAYEMRRRGFDVTARPNFRDRDKQYTFDDLAALWRTADGEPAEWVRPAAPLYAEIAVEGMPPGARGWIAGVWNNNERAAHIWCWEVEDDGTIRWVDAQTNEVGGDAYKALRRLKPGQVYLLRVDDLIPVQEVITMVQETQAGNTAPS